MIGKATRAAAKRERWPIMLKTKEDCLVQQCHLRKPLRNTQTSNIDVNMFLSAKVHELTLDTAQKKKGPSYFKWCKFRWFTVMNFQKRINGIKVVFPNKNTRNVICDDIQNGSLKNRQSCSILLAIELKTYSEAILMKNATVLTLRLKLNQRERHPRSKLLRKPL